MLLLLLCLALTGGIGAYVIDTQQAVRLEEEIQDLQKKMDKVLGEVDKLDEIYQNLDQLSKFSHKVDRVLSSYNGVEAEVGVAEEKEEKAEKIDILPITLKEMRREELQGGYVRYSVRYVKNIEHIVIEAGTDSVSSIEPHIVQLDAKVEEAKMTVKESQDKPEDLHFLVSNLDKTIRVALKMGAPVPKESNVGGITTVLETDPDIIFKINETQVPVIKLSPTFEMVYQEGHDAHLKVFLGKERRDQEYPRTFVQPYLYDLDRDETISSSFDVGDILSPDVEENFVDGGEEFSTTFKTSERRVSGLFLMFAETVQPEPSPLKSVTVVKMLRMRPSNQPQVFPKGVLGFFENPYRKKISILGTEVTLCYNDERTCSGECLAYGGNIADMTARRVLPDGTRAPVDVTFDYGTDSFKALYFHIPPQDKIQTFLCTADTFDGAIITKEISVQFVLDAKILQNSTSARLIDNGNETIIELECGARGEPLPNVTFTLSFDYDGIYDSPADDVIISADGKEVIAQKTVTWDSDVKGNLWSASCSVSSEYRGLDYHEISIPENRIHLNNSLAEYYLNEYVL